MRLILSKFPSSVRTRWCRVADNIISKKKRTVSFDDLKHLLFVCHLFQNGRGEDTPRIGEGNAPSKAECLTKARKDSCNKTAPLSCWYCTGPHIVDECHQISQMGPEEKLGAIRELGLCFGCLRCGPRSQYCRNRKSCNIRNGNHRTLLHRHQEVEVVQGVEVVQEVEVVGTERSNRALVAQEEGTHDKIAMFRAVRGGSIGTGMSVVPIRIRSREERKFFMKAFLDNGSSTCFVSEALMQTLGSTERQDVKVKVETINRVGEVACSLVSGLLLLDYEGKTCITLPPVLSPPRIPIGECDVVRSEDLECWPHLREIYIPDVEAEVSLLIENNVPHLLEPREVINSTRLHEPHAIRTLFGWVVCGAKGKGCQELVNRIQVTSKHLKLDHMLVESYNRKYDDAASNRREMSAEDRKWIEIIEKGVRTVGRSYDVLLPLRGNHGPLPETRDIALPRMHSLRKKIVKDGNYAKQNSAFMTEMQQKGYAEQVTTASPGNVWYIPHFGVQHPDKPDKVRVVFDSASKVEGTLLNDLLLQGPDMMNSLLGVLVKFVGGLFAYIGDINTIFYQVRVPEHQWDYLMFFWWENSLDEEPKEWRMAVHLFRPCSSPSIANFVLKRQQATLGMNFQRKHGSQLPTTIM
ncbi:uncharacterized protein [Palaemon carinicauda]|uniref:uncharacterized protein n=1 Tax=Palaemon carinicauda TaxID=392227 RepID=UPI0035B59450